MHQFKAGVIAIYKSGIYYYIVLEVHTGKRYSKTYLGIKEKTALSLSKKLDLEILKGTGKEHQKAIY